MVGQAGSLMVILYVKPGTHPACYMRVRSLRRPPRVGEAFKGKFSTSDGKTDPGERWSGWRLLEIRGNLYVLEAW